MDHLDFKALNNKAQALRSRIYGLSSIMNREVLLSSDVVSHFTLDYHFNCHGRTHGRSARPCSQRRLANYQVSTFQWSLSMKLPWRLSH